MSNSLKGKTVVITVSGRSIGREMAIRIAAEGNQFFQNIFPLLK